MYGGRDPAEGALGFIVVVLLAVFLIGAWAF